MGAEAGETGCEWEEGSGLRSRLGAAGVSASILSDDLKEALGSIQEEEKTKKTKGKVLETNKLGEEKKKKIMTWIVPSSRRHAPGRSPRLWSPLDGREGWRYVFLHLNLRGTRPQNALSASPQCQGSMVRPNITM